MIETYGRRYHRTATRTAARRGDGPRVAGRHGRTGGYRGTNGGSSGCGARGSAALGRSPLLSRVSRPTVAPARGAITGPAHCTARYRGGVSGRGIAGRWSGFRPVAAAVLIVAVAVAVGIGLSSQAALIAAKGYRIEELKRAVSDIERRNEDLRAETAALTSLDRVEDAAGQLGLVEPEEVRLVYAAPAAEPPADGGQLAAGDGALEPGVVAPADETAATTSGGGLLQALFDGVGRWLSVGTAEAGGR